MPVNIYQFRMHPKFAADIHSQGPMFGTNLIGNPFYSFGEPMEIRKASTAPVQIDSTAPVQRGSTAPVQRDSSAPVQRASTAPVQRGSTAPVQRDSTAPVQTDLTTPVQKNSTVCSSIEDFIIQLELSDFQPDEVKVTSNDHHVTIRARREMPPNTDGCVSRAVINVYNLPEDVDGKFLTAAMNSQGILVIRAARSTIKTAQTL